MAGDGGDIELELFERDLELGLIEGLVQRASDGAGGAVFIEGQAGVGKTELLRAAGKFGSAAGLRVLRGRGTELDRGFAYGVVRQLFERRVSDQPALLEGGAEPASVVFSPGASPRTDDVGFEPLHGLYWLISNLADEQPLMIIADDLHWCDRASLRALVFAVERLDEMPVMIVAAARPTEPGAEQELLDELASSHSSTVLRPKPLSAAAASDLIRSRLPTAEDSFSSACHRATGGNPFLLGELLVELAEQGTTGNAEDAAGVLDFGSDRVGRAIRRRLRMLPAEATSVAQAAAVLGPEPSRNDLTELAGISEPDVARAIDALVEVHVLEDESEPDFVHPVVRSAIYDQIPLSERTALHEAAARLLEERDAEVERVAQHILRLPPANEPTRVAVLREAAAAASSRGAPAAASIYLERALKEPPSGPERGRILLDLGVAEAADRQRSESIAHLREAMSETPDPDERAQIALGLVRALAATANFPEAVEAAEAALRKLKDPEGPLGIALEAELLAIGSHDFLSTEQVAPLWERRLAQLDRGEPLSNLTKSCLVMIVASSRPPVSSALELADRVSPGPLLEEQNSVLGGVFGNGLIYAGALSEAARFYDSAIAISTRRGNRLMTAWQMIMRSDASLRLGEIRRAEFEAVSSFELWDEDGSAVGPAWAAARVLGAKLARGALDEAEEILKGGEVGLNARPSLPLALLIAARAELHLAQGRFGSALDDARAAGDLVSPTITNPSCCAWRSTAALALVALGRREEAIGMAEDELADARRFGNPDAEGASLRTLALTAVGDDSVELLRASVEVLEQSESRLERARSLIELGSALRRAGEVVEGREVLREAMDAASRIGASGLADRAHEELVVAGARPRRDRRLLSGRESLTASEDRVATLAAEGLTNREIAQRQFVTVKAVEWHLRNVFRKLDIESRDQLPEALS